MRVRFWVALAFGQLLACASLTGLSGGSGNDQDGGAVADAHKVDAPSGSSDAGTRDVVTRDVTPADHADVRASVDAGSDAPSDRDAKDANASDALPAPCQIMLNGNVCEQIPEFSGTQTVDGYGNEFCPLPATKFVVAQAYDPQPPDASGVNATALLRIGWSPTALHIHVHVTESPVTPAADAAEPINDQDAIEVFASAPIPEAGLKGPFGANADEAAQFIVAPPLNDAGLARSDIYTSVSHSTPIVALSPDQFASRLVDGGYEVELQLSWSTIAGEPDAGLVGVGAKIAFDLAADIARGSAQHFQSFIYFKAVPDGGAKSPCGGPPGVPFCDDRTWCRTTLVAP